MKPRATEVKFHPPGEKKNWKFKKTKDPDPGSYEYRKGQEFCGKSSVKHRFGPPPGEEGENTVRNKPKETFTTVVSRSKKFVPGVGSYNPKIDYVAVPYGRKRGF